MTPQHSAQSGTSTSSHEQAESSTTSGPRTDSPLVSVVIPCLNEAETIEWLVSEAEHALDRVGIPCEIIVADNASADDSGDLAQQAGARVVYEPVHGYGSAALAGFAAARGKYIILVDAGLRDFQDIPRLVEALDQGADIAIGEGEQRIRQRTMPSFRPFFRTPVHDLSREIRALRRDVLPTLDLRMTGVEFVSEMVLRAAKEGLDIREIPIAYGWRSGESSLSSFRDGWRHLRFLLVHSPLSLVIVPSLALFVVGLSMWSSVFAGSAFVGGSLQTLIVGGAVMLSGVQLD